MKRTIIKIYSAFAVLLFALSSCTSWLDLKPEDKVSDEQLFSTISGFRTSLNGIYIDLNSGYLYGGHMLYDAIELMGQRYDVASSTSTVTTNLSIATYDYESDDCKAIFQSIWERYYFLIGNCNKILEYGEKNKHLFFGNDQGLIIGETYALRAFLHFDLLRLYGPVYATNARDKAIPYNTRFSLSGADILSAEDVMEHIIADLKTAKELLKNDPIIEKGPCKFESADGLNIENYRTERLNYYAVTALMARAYLYAGNNTEALAAAKEVIAVQEKWFPFVQRKQIVDNSSNPDRIFSTELLFCINNSARADIFTKNFSPELTSEILSPKKYLDDMYGGALSEKDWRYSGLWKTSTENQAIDYKCFHKYEEIETADYWKTIVPLIRISEMYYIVAETSTDGAEALAAMNKIYINRGLNEVFEIVDMKKAICDEFVKEFFGEGQLFFYYKRNNTNRILSLGIGKEIQMTANEYVVPLPKSETDFRD